MYKNAIIILISILVIYILYKNNYISNNYISENFEDGLSANNIAGDASENLNTSSQNSESFEAEDVCNSGDWWDNMPVKAIRSKLWGASYNLSYQPDGNIKSPVLVPINNPNSEAPPGCLTVTKNGWQESNMCSDKDADQRWQIVKISNQSEFETALDKAKESGGTVGFTYGYKIDKVDYPFFLVVSKDHPAQGLYYSGSALGVRPLGNYDDQKWDILKDEVKDPITTHKTNFYSKLTPELQVAESSFQSGMPTGNIATAQNLGNNPQALATMLSNLLKQPNTNGAFGVTDSGLKINVNMDEGVISKIVGDSSSNSSNTVEPFTNQSVYYPKAPMDIAVTLNYSTASVPSNNKNNGNNGNNGTNNTLTQTVSVDDIGPNGEIINIGTTQMTKSNDNGQGKCDESRCHPNMNEWMSKPYPCSACVPSNSDTW